jgi:hypothetical protein
MKDEKEPPFVEYFKGVPFPFALTSAFIPHPSSFV